MLLGPRIQIYWTSCWPPGTTFSVARTYKWSSCQGTASLTKVASRSGLWASTDGNSYYVDGNNCLHLKLTDPGRTWQYQDG